MEREPETPKKQDTSNNVWVVVRCRPLSQTEKMMGHKQSVVVDENHGTITVMKETSCQKTPKTFTFDTVFGPDSKQLDVYNLTARTIIDSVLEGYNGTIFAYGQTGAGKTFTMEGVRETPELRGIIPNSFAHIFGHIAKAEDNKRFLVCVSYLEIYNEKVRDLLGKDQMQKLEVKERPDAGICVRGLSQSVVENADDMEMYLIQGHKKRSVGATNMNEHSSRSHAIFTITIECSERDTDGNQHVRIGKLHLVDLAGSERVKKSGATGQRFKEATKINLSLSTLSNVISALVYGRSTHIPYRNSKLTRLLQDSLGGNSKTMMCANIGPAEFNYEETINTLRYANRAKNIANKARINEDPKDALLHQYQKDIEEIKKKLNECENMVSGSDGSGSEETDMSCNEGATGDRNRRRKRFPTEKMMEMEVKIRETTKVWRQNLDMEKKQRNKARTELKDKEHDLQELEKEQQRLREQLSELEKKMIVGGVDLLDKTEEQEKLLQESNKELTERRWRVEQLRKKMDRKKQDHLDTDENYESLKEENSGKSQNLRKTWTMLEDAKLELVDLKHENQIEIEYLLENIHQQCKELRCHMLIIDSFIPQEYHEMIEKNMHWDECIGEWEMRFVAYAGNNMRKETAPPEVERAPLEADLYDIYLAYTEESTESESPSTSNTRQRQVSAKLEAVMRSLLH